jgi:hypothetical protein
MLPLELRPEFRSAHMRGSAIELRNNWLIVVAQRKWDVQGGFPHLCHRGLSLLEAAVPFIELPPT